MSRRDWKPILAKAAEFIESMRPLGVMLRQCHYHLLGFMGYGRSKGDYDYLSEVSAKARRAGTFPKLVDQGRQIHEPLWFADPDDARAWLRRQYRRDRTEGQKGTLYIGVEKVGMLALMQDWFDDLGIPILPMRGYASQSFLDEIVDDARDRGRDDVTVIDVGDFDASGDDTPRNFMTKTGLHVVRVALTNEQLLEHGLRPRSARSARHAS